MAETSATIPPAKSPHNSSATLRDIAEACGVSTRTVGYALSEPERVAPATRARVLRKAAELRYQPNQLARGLRTGRTMTLGAVVTILEDRLLPQAHIGMDEVARASGYSLLVTACAPGPEGERETIAGLRQMGVSGLIILPNGNCPNHDHLRELMEEDFPFVFAGSHDESVVGDFVLADNERAGRLAAEHFLQLGRRQVAFCTVGGEEARYPWASARRRGLERTLAEAGAEAPLVLGAGAPDERGRVVGRQAVSEHLAAHGRPQFNALFAANDEVAHAALEVLQDNGIAVPEEVSLIGYDDEDWSAFLRPALTTFRRPSRRIGQEAVRVLLERIDHGYGDGSRQRLLLEPLLMVRESTAPL